MSKPPNYSRKLSETLTLCQYDSPKNGSFGFWLYDATRGMNLSMRAKTAEAAYLEALGYYQERLLKVEAELDALSAKVQSFVASVSDPEELK